MIDDPQQVEQLLKRLESSLPLPAIVTPELFERMRLLITEEPFLVVEGTVQNTENVGLIMGE